MLSTGWHDQHYTHCTHITQAIAHCATPSVLTLVEGDRRLWPKMPTGDFWWQQMPCIDAYRSDHCDLRCPAPCVQGPPLSIFTPSCCDEPVSELNKWVITAPPPPGSWRHEECPLWGEMWDVVIRTHEYCSQLIAAVLANGFISFLHPSGRRSANTY